MKRRIIAVEHIDVDYSGVPKISFLGDIKLTKIIYLPGWKVVEVAVLFL